MPMIHFFDTNDFDFADWAEKQYGLVRCSRQSRACKTGQNKRLTSRKAGVNGPYRYKKELKR